MRRTPEINPRNVSWSGSWVMCGSSLFHMSGAAIMKVLLYAMVPLRGLSSCIAAPRVGGKKVEWQRVGTLPYEKGRDGTLGDTSWSRR